MHTKKPLSILLTLALVLGLLPWTVMPARAEALTAMPAAVNGKITLNKDVNLSSAWEVNGTVTLDLNGHTVRRSLDGLTESGYVIKINEGASLTLEDSGTGGKITGGKNSTAGGGGGVYVYEGTFIMNGGSITGNRADTSGGGVLVRYSATFIMNGGSITDNISDNNGGGGVAVMNKAKFTMNGGSITGNTSRNDGGGVYVDCDDSVFAMYGGTIEGNKVKIGVGDASGGAGVCVGIVLTKWSGKFIYAGGTIAGNTDLEGGSTSQVYYIQDTSNLRAGTLYYALPAPAWLDGVGSYTTKKPCYRVTAAASPVGGGTVTATSALTTPGAAGCCAEAGQTVTLTATGYAVGSVSYNDGSDHALTPDSDGKCTFTMPDENVTVSATFGLPTASVTYIDATGTERTANAAVLDTDGEAATLAAGWYVVPADTTVSYRGTLTLGGDVNLILAKGATLNVGTSIHPIPSGDSIYGNSATLTVYGQSDGAGALNTCTGVSLSCPIRVKALTVNGGTVTAEAKSRSNAICLAGGDGKLTINGGTVTATVTSDDDASAVSCGSVEMNGGRLDATSKYIAIDGSVVMNGGELTAESESTYAINESVVMNGGKLTATSESSHAIKKSVTLNDGELTAESKSGSTRLAINDSVTLNGGTLTAKCAGEGPAIYGTVTVAPGMTYTDGTNCYTAGELTDNKAAVNGVKLEPTYMVSIPTPSNGTVVADKEAVAKSAAGDARTVTLTVTPTAGCELYTLTVTKAGGGTVTATLGGDGKYTFTMPDENVTVSATFTQPVIHYLDASGAETDCTSYTFLTGGGAAPLAAGWYVVPADMTVSYTGTLMLRGDVHLILADGATLNIGTENSPINNECIGSGASATLTIYGQSGGTGALNAYTSGSSCTAIAASSLTVNGGTVTAKSRNGNQTILLTGGSLTVNGGSLKAANSSIQGIAIQGNVQFNGGTLNAWRSNPAEYTGAILGSVTLNHTGAGGSIAAAYNGIVTVADGKAFTDDDGRCYTGTLTSTINGKTLYPAYGVIIAGAEHGTVTAGPGAIAIKDYASASKTVTLTVTPGSGYQLDTLTVTGATSNNPVTVSGTGNERTFTMPAENVTVSATFKLIPATTPGIPTQNQPKDTTVTYGYTTGNTLTVEANSISGHTLTYQWYSCDDRDKTNATVIDDATSASYTVPTGRDAGTTYYYCVVTAMRDNGATATATSYIACFTIDKATPSITTAPTAKTGLKYMDYAQPLVTAGRATGGEMQYSLNSTDWSNDIPTGTDAKSYTVYYKVVGDENHNDVAPKSVTASIDKADQAAPSLASLVAITSGDTATISGVTADMEYSTDNKTWTDCTDPFSVGKGVYYIRLKADANHNAGAAATVVVKAEGEYVLMVTGGTGSGSYEAAASVSVSATVPAGERFVKWTPVPDDVLTDEQKTSASVTFAMPDGDVTLSAYFEDKLLESVSLPATLSLRVGATQTLTPTFTPSDFKNKAVTWESADTSVVTVDENGKLTAVAVGGPVNITLTSKADGSKTAVCAVTVTRTTSGGGSSGGSSSSSGNDYTPSTPSNTTTTTTTTDTGAVTNADGSKTDSTSKTTETKNADGSTTAKTTETATTTATDGSKNETKAETSTTTKQNSDGSTTATTTATETSTTTAADGSKTTTETKTEAKETLNKSGNGTVEAKTTETVKDESGKVTETTVTESRGTVETTADGTKTTVTTNTATTTNAATGEQTTVVTTEKTVEAANGSTGKVVSDQGGNTVSVEAKISESAAQTATRSGEAVTLPVEVKAASNAAEAVAVEISVPESAKNVKVEIPVENMTPGTVAVIVNADGTEEIVKTSTTGENGVVLTLESGASVKVVDNAKEFSDVKGDEWFANNVAWSSSHEVMNGMGDGTFAPDAPTTQGMMEQILYNIDGNELIAPAEGEDWWAAADGWAANGGVTAGLGETHDPAAPATREADVLMMYNYAMSKGYDVSARADLSKFSDESGVSAEARDAMAWAVAVGLINGSTDENGNIILDAQGVATRAQVSAIVERFCENVAK